MPDDIDYGGPWLQTAVFCERVLYEKDGVVSLIRIVDRFTFTASGPDAPERIPPGAAIPINGLLTFKSGFAKGSYTVTVTVTTPTNRKLRTVSLPMFLEGDDRGVNLGFNANLVDLEEGLYWFDVRVGDRLVTRMPLRIVYQRFQGAAIQPGPSLRP